MYSPFILLLSPNVSVNAGFLYDKGARHVVVITKNTLYVGVSSMFVMQNVGTGLAKRPSFI
jgi:hypothetical protein